METEINQDKITNKERVSYALKDLITLKNYNMD